MSKFGFITFGSNVRSFTAFLTADQQDGLSKMDGVGKLMFPALGSLHNLARLKTLNGKNKRLIKSIIKDGHNDDVHIQEDVLNELQITNVVQHVDKIFEPVAVFTVCSLILLKIFVFLSRLQRKKTSLTRCTKVFSRFQDMAKRCKQIFIVMMTILSLMEIKSRSTTMNIGLWMHCGFKTRNFNTKSPTSLNNIAVMKFQTF